MSELVKRYPTRAAVLVRDREDCPTLLKSGCGLSRKDRPETCQTFLCDLAVAVNDKRVSLAWVWKYFDELGGDPVMVLSALTRKVPMAIMHQQNARIQLEWEQEQLEKKAERRCLAC